MSKEKRLDEDSRKYRIEEIRVAIEFCPPISPCKECGWPVVYGYCCTHCGNGDGP